MEQKQAIADRLKQSNNILVTVSNNPSVDQLASCIGLTLALNKMGKHATAVFSGNVPSTIEFLQPEKTLEKNTDSLRDFIIALDKSKADKLRYKVEDKVVKIFITPYKTSINEKDLEFSQGDFNVDVVVALGVHQQNELDQAITAHGRILHDAVVATVNTKAGGELGTINWLDGTASSLSELVAQLLDVIDKQVVDGQMATALLTGIVAETERFSNEKTSPNTMSISAELMGAGANQQLVATKLEEPAALPPPPPPATPVHESGAKLQGEQGTPESHADDGTLEIAHAHDTGAPGQPEQEPEEKPEKFAEESLPPFEPEPERKPEEPEVSQIHIDEHGALQSLDEARQPAHGSIDPTQHMASSHMILQPPEGAPQMQTMGAGGMAEEEEQMTDPLSLPSPDAGAGFGNSFGPLPAASASIAPAPMPFLPPSMTPGGRISPAAPPAGFSPAPPGPNPAVAATPSLVPEPPAPSAPSIVQPTAPLSAAPPPPPVEPDLQLSSLTNPVALSPAAQLAAPPAPTPPPVFAVPAAPVAAPGETLSQIEADVHSPHAQPTAAPAAPADPGTLAIPAPPSIAPPMAPPAAGPPLPPAPVPAAPPAPPTTPAPVGSPDLASARDAVMQAIAGGAQPPVGPEPIKALNAQPLGDPLHENQAQPPAPQPAPAAVAPAAPPILDAAANPTFTLPDVAAAPPATPPPMLPPTPGA